MKGKLSALAAAAVVAAAGVMASGCDATPTAASANGQSIDVSALNTQLQALQQTPAGTCLLQIESASGAVPAQGTGGDGTYPVGYAKAVLDNQLGILLAGQFASSLGLGVTASELSAARSELASSLSGEINQLVQQAGSQGTASYCQSSNGSTLTGDELLSALPASVRDQEIRNEAVNQQLLARGADISDSAAAAYYAANQPQFTTVCVSVIVTDTQDKANQLAAQIAGGTPFASVAKASSIDAQTAANGGSVGCNFTLAEVEQSLQLDSLAAGQAIPPIQDPASGEWLIYQVASETVVPLAQAMPAVKHQLLETSSNLRRVNAEFEVFARHSNVFVDPRYGTWKGTSIAAPPNPAPRFLAGYAPSTPSPGSSGSSGSNATNGTGSASGSSDAGSAAGG